MKRLLFILLLLSTLLSQATYTLDLHSNLNNIGFPVLPNSTDEVIELLYPFCEIYTDTIPDNIQDDCDDTDYYDGLITSNDVLQYDKGYIAICSENVSVDIYGNLPNSDCIEYPFEYPLNCGWNFISFPLLPEGGPAELLTIVEQYGAKLEAILGEGISAFNYDSDGDGDGDMWIGSLQYFFYGEGYYFKATEAFNMTVCGYPVNSTWGCTDPYALNYDEDAIIDDASCQYPALGDMNNDTIFNISDVIIMVGYVLNNEYVFYADLNEDDFLNILDILILANWILE